MRKSIYFVIFLLLISYTTATDYLKQGLLYYYSLDDARDVYGNFDLTQSGGTFTTGKVNNGYDCEAGNYLSGVNYVTISDIQ